MNYLRKINPMPILPLGKSMAWESCCGLELVGENVGKFELEFVEQGFELHQGQVMFAFFKAKQGHGRKPCFLCKLSIRQFASGLSQKLCQLLIKALSHPKNCVKNFISDVIRQVLTCF